jgi:hypothetical protein
LLYRSQPLIGQFNIILVQLHAQPVAAGLDGDLGDGAGAEERIENDAGSGGGIALTDWFEAKSFGCATYK